MGRRGRPVARLGHPVATIDLRGHGHSDKPDDGYDFTTMGDDLIETLDAVGFARPCWPGSRRAAIWSSTSPLGSPNGWPGSSGSTGAPQLTRQWPDWEECKAALTPPRLAGTPADAVEGWLRESHPHWSDWGVAATMANFEILDDGTIRPWLALDHHLRILRALWEHQPSTVIPKLDTSVLLVMADTADDWAGQKRAISGELTAAAANVQVEWFSPGDHDLHVQFPIELADLLHATFA